MILIESIFSIVGGGNKSLNGIDCSGCREVAAVVPGGLRHRQGEDAAYSPHPPRTCPQLLRLLLRDPQRPRQGVPARQAGRLFFPIAATEGQDSYAEAMELAKANLAPTNAVRLGLALNYSVYFYEVAMSPDRACQLAKKVSVH